MELTQDQKNTFRDTAKRMVQGWIQGLTDPESKGLGGHSMAALERQFGLALIEGFKMAEVAGQLASAVAHLEKPTPEPNPPEPDPEPSLPEPDPETDSQPETDPQPDPDQDDPKDPPEEPELSSSLSKARLVSLCKDLGAPQEYIRYYLGDESGVFRDGGKRRRPKKSEKEQVCRDIIQAQQEGAWVQKAWAKEAGQT